jgi:pimeloyl-ACP methyl ester carboxylesterase
MPKPQSIYKSPAAKAEIMALYDAKLAACKMDVETQQIDTFAGATYITMVGPKDCPAVVLLHGINAGAPLALEAMRALTDRYRIYAIDSVGQATKSAETRLPILDNSYGQWLAEVLDGLGLDSVPVIGVSYGAFLLQRLLAHAPKRVSKTIFVVPGGLVNGSSWESVRRLMFPLMRFQFSKNERHLVRFMSAFYKTKDPHSIAMQKAILTGVRMDYRNPPLLKAAEVANYDGPVYAMIAEDDIFFPGQAALARCKLIFKNFKGSAMLQGAKHIPDQTDYPQIAAQLDAWLCE